MGEQRNGNGTPKLAEQLSEIGGFVARRRRHLVVRQLGGLCRRYRGWYGNASYDVRTNGEFFVLQTLTRFRPRVIFDVGAH